MKTNKLGAEAIQVEKGGVTYLTYPRFADSSVVKHAISTRLGGVGHGIYSSLNLSYKVKDNPMEVAENRFLLSQAIGMDLGKAVWLDQVHSDKVFILDAINSSARGKSLGEGDGIITNETDIPIQILVADCLPVLFYDPVHKAIGLAHAGWRGTVGHIAAKTLLTMGEVYGTNPSETRVVLGPCIGPCCYEVGPDVHDEIINVFPWGSEVVALFSPNHWKLDLEEANARQLIEIGVSEENLVRSGLCTVKNNILFFSHRAESAPGESTGRFGSFIMLTS